MVLALMYFVQGRCARGRWRKGAFSGHKDIKTFNMYHKVDDKARFNAVNDVFGSMKAIRVEEIEQ